jgi:guanine deaminase
MIMTEGFRGKLFYFDKSANITNLAKSYHYFENGMLIVKDGLVEDAGEFLSLSKKYSGIPVNDYRNCFIMPGFIDAHIHSVQTRVLASNGKELLEWLDNYIFPQEQKFEDADYARVETLFFMKQLIRNGTTTALIYPSVHKSASEAVFALGARINMRLICGNTWMDRNAPAYLLRQAKDSYDDAIELIEKWHNRNRLKFAVTPRYAITSSPTGLELAAQLFHQFDDLYVQTHISENSKEIEVVEKMYGNRRNYLDVYDHYGLLSKRTFLGHGIHLTNAELNRIAECGCAIVHCPTSNLFLGSGLFDMQLMNEKKINVAIGSDVGAGTSFSMLQTLSDAYKVSSLRKNPINALQAFYSITLGAARALNLDNCIGNFDKGMEADFVIIDPEVNPLIGYRIEETDNLEEILFALMILSDDRIIKDTFLMGESQKTFLQSF